MLAVNLFVIAQLLTLNAIAQPSLEREATPACNSREVYTHFDSQFLCYEQRMSRAIVVLRNGPAANYTSATIKGMFGIDDFEPERQVWMHENLLKKSDKISAIKKALAKQKFDEEEARCLVKAFEGSTLRRAQLKIAEGSSNRNHAKNVWEKIFEETQPALSACKRTRLGILSGDSSKQNEIASPAD